MREIRLQNSKGAVKRWLVLVGLVAVALTVASVVSAAWVTINLGDGNVDGTWGNVSYSETTNDAGINDQDDIRNAWVRFDGTNIYFRVETFAGPVLSSSNYRLVGAIDCNGDGDFDDPVVSGPDGDRLVVYAPDGSVTLYDGAFTGVGPVSGDYSDPTIRDASTTSIEWGTPLYLLIPACRGSVSPVNIGWAIAQGNGTVIDSSATPFEISNPMDYGDTGQTLSVPPATCGSPYTGLQCNGARHGIVPMTPGVPLRLGSAPVDADPGNLQSASSDADDVNGTTPDDEGGIAPTTGNDWDDGNGQLTFSILGAQQVKLSCWVDFNKNGTWTDAGENIVNSVTLLSTATLRSVTIPGGLTWPNDFPARCRIAPSSFPTPMPPNGAIEYGEVEDHIWSFDAQGLPISPNAPTGATNLVAATANTSDVRLTWTNPAPNDSARILGHASNPYFTSATGGFLFDTTDTAAPWEYLHTGVRGAPASTVYYIVYGRLGSTDASTPSNRVGLFEFGLVKGQ